MDPIQTFPPDAVTSVIDTDVNPEGMVIFAEPNFCPVELERSLVIVIVYV
jgi:hypothetical protein